MRYNRFGTHTNEGSPLTEKARYWWRLVEYDPDTAKSLLATRRYLYVGFLCHLIIEKSLKAVIAGLGSEPPRIHNLARLAEFAGLLQEMSAEQLSVLDDLDPMNIEGRYPGDIDNLARTLNAKRCALMLAQTEELCQWIRAR